MEVNTDIVAATFTMFIMLAILVEMLVQRFKAIVQVKEVKNFSLVPIYAIVIALVVTFVAQIDFFIMLGFDTTEPIGYILSGLIISGGSMPIHEGFSKLRESRNGGEG